MRINLVTELTVPPLTNASDAQEPTDNEVAVVTRRGSFHFYTHVVGGTAARTRERRGINWSGRIENSHHVSGKVIDLAPAEPTAHDDDLLVIGRVL